jgi:hypothetical protein
MTLAALPDPQPAEATTAPATSAQVELAKLVQREQDERVAAATAEFQQLLAAWGDKFNTKIVPVISLRGDGRQVTQILIEIRG